MITRSEVFVGGRFVPALSTSTLSLVNPATEQAVGQAADGGAADVAAAVAAASAALPGWRATPAAARSAALSAVADGFERRAEEIGRLVALQNSSPRWWTEIHTERMPVGAYRAAAAMARGVVEEEIATGPDGRRSLVLRQPLGVVGVIVPWNAPQILLAGRVAYALAAGCPVVIKPSPETSLDALVLAEVFAEAGIPPGVVNIVTGGVEAGRALVAHPNVAKIAFTGSTAAGRAIAAACGQALKPVTAELGGKSAAVILDDADLEAFAGTIQMMCLPFSGQACFSTTRVLVPRALESDVVELAAATLRAFPFGDPADPAVVMGPVVTARQRERVEGLVRSGIDDGAKAALGGAPSTRPVGFYVEPTILTGVTPAMRVFREEIFGPVLTVTGYDTEDEAVALHDATGYGLNGSVFSRDTARAAAFARRLTTGQVLVNGERGAMNVPFTLLGDSGVGSGAQDRVPDYQITRVITQP